MGRCTAQSKRSGEQCKNWAIRKKTTCRFHGGRSTGPRTKEGKEKVRTAHFKHGRRTQAHQQRQREVRQVIKDSMNFLGNFG